MKQSHYFALLSCSLFLLFFSSINAQTCSEDSPYDYTVVGGEDGQCYLEISWKKKMPKIECGSPGSPALGSNVPRNRKLKNLYVTVNGITYELYKKTGNKCNANSNIAYGSRPNTYITTFSSDDFCIADAETFIPISGNQTGARSFKCNLPNSNIPAPIELISFNGQANENANVLTWETASEENAWEFIIEKSNTGLEPFKEVARVEAAGFSSTIQQYQVKDFQPEPIAYYRLRNLDYDDQYSLSKLIVIERESANKADMKVFPVPYKSGPLYLSYLAEKEEEVAIDIFNQIGQLVYKSTFYSHKGVNTFTLDMPPQLDAKLYLVYLEGDGHQAVRKVICTAS